MEYKEVINNIKPYIEDAKKHNQDSEKYNDESKSIDGELTKLDKTIKELEGLEELGEIGKSEISRAMNKKASLISKKNKLENKSKSENVLANKVLKEAKKEIDGAKKDVISKINKCTEELNLREETIKRCKNQMLTLKEESKTKEYKAERNRKKYKATNAYVKKILEEKKNIAKQRTNLINTYREEKPRLDNLETLLDISKLEELEKEVEKVNKTRGPEPKVTDPKVTDPKVTDPKITDPKATDPKITEPKATDPKVTDPKVTDPKVTDPKVTDPKVTDPKITDPKITDPKATEPKVTDPKVTDPKVTDPKITDPKATDPKATDPKVTDPKITEPKVTEPKVTDPKVTDPKITDPKVTDPKVTDPKITDPKATDSKDPVAKNIKQNRIDRISINFALKKIEVYNENNEIILDLSDIRKIDKEQYQEKAGKLTVECLEELQEEYSNLDMAFIRKRVDHNILGMLAHLDRKEEIKQYIAALYDKNEYMPFLIDYNTKDIYKGTFSSPKAKHFNEIAKFAEKQQRMSVTLYKDPLYKQVWDKIKLKVSEWRKDIQQMLGGKAQEALPSGEEKQQIPPTIHELENELNQDRINNQRNNESIETTKSNQEAKDNARQEKKEDDNGTKFVQTFSEECMYVLSGKTPEEIQERYDAAGGHIKFSADEIEAVFSKKGELRATERQQENEIEDKNIDTPQEEKEGEEI